MFAANMSNIQNAIKIISTCLDKPECISHILLNVFYTLNTHVAALDIKYT